MEVTYYAIISIILVFAIPLISKKYVYANGPEPKLFNPVEGMAKTNRQMLTVAFILAGAFLVFFCATKDETTIDNLVYLSMYTSGSLTGRRGVEPTFAWITSISPTFEWLLAIYATLAVSFNLYAIRRLSPNIWLSLFCYLTFFFIIHNVIQIRAGVATSIFLLSIAYIAEKKWWIFYPLCVAAFLFHYSSIIMLPLFFLPRKKVNKWIWSLVLIGSLGLAVADFGIGIFAKVLPIDVIQNALHNYSGNKEYEAGTIGVTIYLKIIVGLLLLFNIDKIRENYPFAPVVATIFVLSLIIKLLLRDIPVLSGRLSEFLGVSEIFAYAMFPMISKKHYYIMIWVPIVLMLYQHFTSGHNLLIGEI